MIFVENKIKTSTDEPEQKVTFFLQKGNKKDTIFCIIIMDKQHTKEGVLNEKLELKKLLTYIKSVYLIPQKIKSLTDKRKRKSIPLFNILMPVLLMLLLQYESFHTFWSSPESMKKRLRHCIKGKIPKVDAVRDMLLQVNSEELKAIHDTMIDRVKRNRVLHGGTIGGYVTVAIDGLELFSSYKKKMDDCLTRTHKNGETEYFYRSVVCATIGSNPHLILGQEMLKPRDGAEKDEGELTGGKRLLKNLKKRHGRFADVVVADALYLNAPFINTVTELGMDAVIRLKDEKRLIFQDAEGMFKKDLGKKECFKREKTTIEVWDLCGFEMQGTKQKLRVIKYRESAEEKGKTQIQEVWLATTLESADYKVLWKMMHRRWDIEENAFHQLKTYYHAKHCYCKNAVENIFWLEIIAFNSRELYLFRRIKNFEGSKITRTSVSRKFQDNLLTDDFRKLLYTDSG